MAARQLGTEPSRLENGTNVSLCRELNETISPRRLEARFRKAATRSTPGLSHREPLNKQQVAKRCRTRPVRR